MIIYYIFLCILIIIWLLFVYNLPITVVVTTHSLKVYLYKIRVFYKKDEKLRKFLKKLIPTDKTKVKEEIDMSSLIQFMHIDVIDLQIKHEIKDYPRYIYLIHTIQNLEANFHNLIHRYVTSYRVKIELSQKNDLNLLTSVHFNIGTIVLNFILIKRRYRKCENQSTTY